VPDIKTGPPLDKITSYLGQVMKVDLKNHHQIIGVMSFYHLSEQMIHLQDWEEFDAEGKPVRRGAYMVVNRTAWFQLLKE